jgi:hemoglobin
MNQPTHIYDLIGEQAFVRLIASFYRQVAVDPILQPLYPAQDMAGAEERLRLFLIQYFGGPTTYSQQRGHPRLRMRHAPFTIGTAERDAWLKAMLTALTEAEIHEPAYTIMKEYFVGAAEFMINVRE